MGEEAYMKPILVILLGALVLAWGFYELATTIADVKSFSSTQGSVVRLIESQNADDVTYYRPVIKFDDPSGTVRQFKSKVSTPSQFEWRVGEEVEVLFDPANPARARLKGGDLWRGAIYALIFGGGVMFMGIYHFRRRKDPASSE
jgi:hypothetical protein